MLSDAFSGSIEKITWFFSIEYSTKLTYLGQTVLGHNILLFLYIVGFVLLC